MEKLKCIGGPNDGEIVSFDPDQLEIALNKDSAVAIRAPVGGYGRSNASVEFRRTRYTRRRIRTDERSCIEFLAPEDWTDAEALGHALAP